MSCTLILRLLSTGGNCRAPERSGSNLGCNSVTTLRTLRSTNLYAHLNAKTLALLKGGSAGDRTKWSPNNQPGWMIFRGGRESFLGSKVVPSDLVSKYISWQSCQATTFFHVQTAAVIFERWLQSFFLERDLSSVFQNYLVIFFHKEDMHNSMKILY